MTIEKEADLKSKIHLTIAEMEGKNCPLNGIIKPIFPENFIGRISKMNTIKNKSVAGVAMRSAKKGLVK